jgi:hypothetical protein
MERLMIVAAQRRVIIAALACVGTAVPMARATIIDITVPNRTLADVLGNQFLVGDKLFSVSEKGFRSTTFTPSQIFISPLVNADPLSGQGFRLSGSFLDPPGNGGSDFVFQYTVEITPDFINRGFRIDDADLRFNGSATGAGSFSRVDETLLDENNHILDNKSVFAFGTGTPPDHLEDHSFFAPPRTFINVVKDVQFFAAGADGTATASFVDQEFSQVVIPLPVGAGLGLAGLGLVAIRRRR